VDAAVDGVVAFRFLHHLDRRGARVALDEATRVAARWLVVSFFHPISWHHARRSLRSALRREAPRRHAVWPATLARWLEQRGFAPAAWAADAAYRRDLWVASFRRIE
jgi:hypothetical protein